MSPNDADGMANSVDPDQTAPLGAVWSGSALFAQAYLSENLEPLRYVTSKHEFLRLISQHFRVTKTFNFEGIAVTKLYFIYWFVFFLFLS